MNRCLIALLSVVSSAILIFPGCKSSDPSHAGVSGKDTGTKIISVDGSSTVYPITEAVAEEFQKTSKARVTIGVSGSGGGFKKFCRAETDINDASRPIKGSEVRLCKQNGIEYIELAVAYDGIAVVVNPRASWVDFLSVSELKKLWEPEAQGKVMRWSQVRQGWPDEEIHLFGPGVDSGTYDYFTHAIVGTEHSSRGDFTSSEDDNILVHGVANDRLALGFFGLAYYIENSDKLKVVPIDADGDGSAMPVAPSFESVSNGTYQPLSRPLFIYISMKSVQKPQVRSFVDYYLNSSRALIKEVGYIPLPQRTYSLVKERFHNRITGSVFGGHGSKIGVSVEQLLTGK